MPTFDTGIEEAKAAADAASSGNANFFRMKSGDIAFVRPFIDITGVITVEMHGGVKTKPAPKGAQKWPDTMGAVCQNDKVFRLRGENRRLIEPPQWEEGYGNCYIHRTRQGEIGNFKRSVAETRPQTWGVFVMRKPLRRVDGALVPLSDPKTQRPEAFEDEMTDFKMKTGEIVKLPRLVYVTQSYSNFWEVLAATVYMDGTWTNRDFRVLREDNEYTFSPSPEDRSLFPDSDAWKAYEVAAELRGISIGDAIVAQASPKYYGRFFDDSYVDPEGDGGDESGSGADTDSGAQVDEAQVAKTKARMASAFGSQDVLATQPS
jgi:hypothetical protein